MRQKQSRIVKSTINVNCQPTTVQAEQEIDVCDMNDTLHTLKCAKIPEQLDFIKEKLLATKNYRQELIRNKAEKISLKNNFPYFFVDCELVNLEISFNEEILMLCFFYYRLVSSLMLCFLKLQILRRNTTKSKLPSSKLFLKAEKQH
jgi:hypothetical protein